MAAHGRDRRRRGVQGVHGVGAGPAGLRARRPGHRPPGRRAGAGARREGDLRAQGPAAARVRPSLQRPGGHGRAARRSTPTWTSSCTTAPSSARPPRARTTRPAPPPGSTRWSRRCDDHGVAAERQRLGRARHHLARDAERSRPGGARARQAAAARRRGPRAVGHRRHLVRLTAAADHGVPRLPDHAPSTRSATAIRRSPTR